MFLPVNMEIVRIALYKTRFLTHQYEQFATKSAGIRVEGVVRMFGNTPGGSPFPTCSPGYHADGGCLRANFSSWTAIVVPRVVQLYASLFVATRLVFSYPKYIRNPLGELYSLLLQTARSSLFLSVDLGLAKASSCISKFIAGPTHRPWLIRLILALAGLGVTLENPGRQAELLSYCLWQVIQAYVHEIFSMSRAQQRVPQGVFKNVVPSVLFGLASVLWVTVLRICPAGLKSTDRWVLNCCLLFASLFLSVSILLDAPSVNFSLDMYI